jgi:hypothetical protein
MFLMSTSPHRVHHDLYRGPKGLKDPGNAGIIRANADLQICEMVSGASGETRTLATPTKPGIRLVLRLKTDGGGDVVVTASAGLNVALETQATFADASDFLSLISVTISGTSHRWEILEGNVGTVVSSASVSNTPSSSPSASQSTSPSASVSNTPSSSASSSPSAT